MSNMQKRKGGELRCFSPFFNLSCRYQLSFDSHHRSPEAILLEGSILVTAVAVFAP